LWTIASKNLEKDDKKKKKNQKEMAQNFKTFHFNAPVAKFG
jgi:hypothetical protein